MIRKMKIIKINRDKEIKKLEKEIFLNEMIILALKRCKEEIIDVRQQNNNGDKADKE